MSRRSPDLLRYGIALPAKMPPKRRTPAGCTHDADGNPVVRGTHAHPERDAQAAVVRYLRQVLPAGSIVAAIKNEEKPRSDDEHARARFVATRKAQGLWPGCPDLMVLLPGPRTVFIEMKAPGLGRRDSFGHLCEPHARLSDHQIVAHADLNAINIPVGSAESIDDARHLLRQWGVVTRDAASQPT